MKSRRKTEKKTNDINSNLILNKIYYNILLLILVKFINI